MKPEEILAEAAIKIASKRAAEEAVRTAKVMACGSYAELMTVVRELAPFVSYSRPDAKAWGVEKIRLAIESIRHGAPVQYMTRVNGLRGKVAELVMGSNYGAPWEETKTPEAPAE